MNPVSGVVGRIATIEARFAPPPPADGAPGTAGAAGPTGFDPFGEQYQLAVEAARARPVATAQPAFDATFAAAPYSYGAGSAAPYGAASPTAGGATYGQTHAAVAGVATTPGPRPVGGYGPMPVPDELARMGNGRLDPNSLYPVGQGGHRLHAPAAASWRNLVAAAAADGIEMRITDSYRSYDEQVDLVRRKGLYSQGGLGATPGTSKHGWGLAVDADVTDPATQRWLQTNGPRFGWVESVPREPWHWEFRPNQV